VICRPLDWGADMVIQSLTKYYEGHNIMTGGDTIGVNRCNIMTTIFRTFEKYTRTAGYTVA
jgi:O-acetylhomoserine/O-acetylserine sulfhydrylase-like pyridoxal-dependent enzyme